MQVIFKSNTKISSARARLVRIPLDTPRGDAIQKFTALELPMVQISDEDGNTGVGFGYTIGSGGSTIVHLLRNELLGRIVGHDSAEIAAVHEFLTKAIHALTPGCMTSVAFAAVDIALWDLAARRAKIPLYKMLGGAKSKVPVYNTHVGWLNRPLDEVVELSKEAVKKRGFKALKLKVGKDDPAEDEERVHAVRRAVGPHVKLMVDANQSWTLYEAIKRAKMLEQYDLVWLEEPLPAEEIHNFAKLAQHTRIALAGGESIYNINEFFQYARCDALGVMQPDVARIGGITNAMRVCALAQTAGVKVSPHVSPELSVTVACAVPNSMFIEYIPQMEPILSEKIAIQDGCAIPFNRPGHGIEFDWEAVARMEVEV